MYISVSDAATKFNISRRRVQFLCEQGRISGANMIDGVWLIPETATKPADRRKKHLDENQMSLFDTQKGSFTIDDICKTLSISKATAKNWIRLGKIVPDMNGQLGHSCSERNTSRILHIFQSTKGSAPSSFRRWIIK